MAISAANVMELRNITGAGMMDCKKALQESDGDLEKASEFLRKKGVAVAAKKSTRETNEGAVALAFSDDSKKAAIIQLACETDFVSRNENFQSLTAELVQHVLANGDVDVADQKMSNGSGSVGERITTEIGKMGENLKLVDARQLSIDGEGYIGGYVHSNGKIGVLIALSSDGSATADGMETVAKDLAMHIAASQVSAVTEDEIDADMIQKERDFLVSQAKESGKPDEIIEKMVTGRMNKFVAENTLMSQAFVKDPERTVAQFVADAEKEIGGKVTPTSFVKMSF